MLQEAMRKRPAGSSKNKKGKIFVFKCIQIRFLAKRKSGKYIFYPMNNSRKLVLLLLIVALSAAGCANPGIKKQKEMEKRIEKEEKERIKGYEEAKKQHYRLQTKETQQRMKESEKNYRKQQKNRRK